MENFLTTLKYQSVAMISCVVFVYLTILPETKNSAIYKIVMDLGQVECFMDSGA